MSLSWPTPGGQPFLETPRLRLRPLMEADAEAVHAWASDPEVARYASWPRHRSLEDSLAFIRAAADGGPLAWVWGLERKDTGRLAGSAGLHDWDPQARSLEAGYILGRPHWGVGLASETLAALLDLAHGTLRAHRVEAFCFEENRASRHVLEKAGFRLEGLHRDRIFAHDRFWNRLTYARLEGD